MAQCTDEEVQRMLPLVSAQRREQALRYKHTFGRFCCLKSWLMLQEELGGMGVREVGEFDYNEHGKPFLVNGPYFSISHCKEGIAVAIDDEPIGIDIEHIRKADRELIQRTMNEEEVRLIARALDKADIAFTRLWTRKEAVVKAQGTGILSFEQLQSVLDNRTANIETVNKEKYIYSIAYGKLHCFSA